MYKLYVFLRSDLESLTPGKAAAQVAHAASQCADRYKHEKTAGVKYLAEFYKEWCGDRGFGTTIVLDAGTFDRQDILCVSPNAQNVDISRFSIGDDIYTDNICINGSMVTDTSYPLRDGKVTHELQLHTCYWAFLDPDNMTREELKWLKSFRLYNGNHD
jgi:peptidyl-tRNA hydrolase